MAATLVTGAAGHIGGNLVRALIAKDKKVLCLVRNDERALKGLPVEIIKSDILDYESLLKAVSRAEVVYHLAAHISIQSGEEAKLRRINVEGTRNIVSACLAAGIRRLVHFSSVHSFAQFPFDEPIDENRPLVNSNESLSYDLTKALGEREVLAGVEKGLDAVIVNPSAVLGRNDFKPSRMGEVLLALYRRKMPGLIDGAYDWVDVRDVVDGALNAERLGRRGERYILSGHYLSFAELARLVTEVTGVKAPRLVFPMWLARFGAPFATLYAKSSGRRPLYTRQSLKVLRGNGRFSNEKAGRELGYNPRPIRETIADFFEWYEEYFGARGAR
ncbi:MAG: NAD-dependent epimerase/dehydratase family protein [Myxococcota bacterium]